MSNTISNFISNYVKGICFSEKRLKIFKYLKSNIHHSGSVFLQETHSLTQDEKKWKNDFKDPLFFLKSLHIIDKKFDENGRILITDAKVNDEKLLLVNLYNSNTEFEQIKTIH